MADDGAVSTPVRTPWVVGRALALAAVALAAGSLAHLGADGRLPGPGALAALLLLGTTAAVPLLRRPASTARVVTLLVAGQAGVHLALTLLAGHHDDGVVGHGPLAALHHLAEDATGPHAAMALAHTAAAALVGLWLASGERALWTVLDLLVAPLAGRSLPTLPVRRPAPAVVVLAPSGPRRVLLHGGPNRRGPPYVPA